MALETIRTDMMMSQSEEMFRSGQASLFFLLLVKFNPVPALGLVGLFSCRRYSTSGRKP